MDFPSPPNETAHRPHTPRHGLQTPHLTAVRCSAGFGGYVTHPNPYLGSTESSTRRRTART
jgi:hypothetical protein